MAEGPSAGAPAACSTQPCIKQPCTQRAGGQSWPMAAYLLLNGIVAPALLAEPYAFAVLGWAGGTVVNVTMALASWYCMYHQASLFHYKGGRNSTYKLMGNAILTPYMGRWGGVLVASLQYFINVGTVITNMILTGQLLQNVYMNLCTDAATCTFTNTSAWIGLGGMLSYTMFIALPHMSALAWASMCGVVCAVFYCVAGMVLAGLDGSSATANYTITGPLEQRVFNAFNGIGVCLFLYGITVLPEIQAVLVDDPATGNTTWPMIKAATAVHFVFVPLYMLVGIIGFWAYGTDVNSFLLFAVTTPKGLVVAAMLAAALQQQLVSQVAILPVFEASERTILRRFKCSWMLAKPLSPAAPGQDTAQRAAALPVSRMASLATSMASITIPGLEHHHHHLQSQQQSLPVTLSQDKGVGVGACNAGSNIGTAACSADGLGLAAAAADGPSASLMLLVRTALTCVMLFFACAMPFFASIMGFVGAVGFGPITYALPTVLYVLAFGSSMPRLEWWFNVAFVAFWLLASLLGAVGSVYAIVLTASNYTFFS